MQEWCTHRNSVCINLKTLSVKREGCLWRWVGVGMGGGAEGKEPLVYLSISGRWVEFLNDAIDAPDQKEASCLPLPSHENIC